MITDPSRLYRSSHHAVLGGVCGGLAQKLRWPISLVRVAALVLISASGVGLVLYLLGWMILPVIEPSAEPEPMPEPITRNTRTAMVAGVCGGLADKLGADVSVVRIAFALMTLFAGTGLVAYLVAWVLLPADDGLGAWVG